MAINAANVPEDTLGDPLVAQLKVGLNGKALSLVDHELGEVWSVDTSGNVGPTKRADVGQWLKLAAAAGGPNINGWLGGGSFSGSFDPVVTIGSNIAANGLPESASYGTMAMNIEGHFIDSGVHYQELHLIAGKADGSVQTRMLTFQSRQDQAAPTAAFNLELLNFNKSNGVLFVSMNPANKTFTQEGGTWDYILAAGGGVGGGPILQWANDENAARYQLVGVDAYGGLVLTGGITNQISLNASDYTYCPGNFRAAGGLDVSDRAANVYAIKATATSDTPSTTYTAHVASTDPAGFIKVSIGGDSKYLPYYA